MPMSIAQLQRRLAERGCFAGPINGEVTSDLKTGILAFLGNGPDYPLDDADFVSAAAELDVPSSYVKALYEVESSGNAFNDAGLPTVLPEPHRFSRATGHRFDASYPTLSYPNWDRSKYPRTQAARYRQLVDMICLDPDAGFASASYGGFQILGENFARCGARDAMAFAWQESQTQADQLHHFVLFIKSDPKLWSALKRADWATVARLYNGTGYRLNHYDVRLAQAQGRAAA